jgi:putative tricarboxylic transport membrane protein
MSAGGETTRSGAARPRRSITGELVIALCVIAFAALVYWQTLLIPVSPIYAQVGPTLFPTMTAFCLAVLGVLLLVSAFRGGWQLNEEREAAPDRVALAWIAAGLVLNVVLIGPAGFTVASMVLFVCVARGFGSRSPVRDAGIAAVLALAAYFGFAKALGINIGAGLVENAIERLLPVGGR